MGARFGILMLSLLLLISACARPAPPAASTPGASSNGPADAKVAPLPPANRPNVDPPGPAAGSGGLQAIVPRLILDLPLGDEPDQPGRFPARVGGISPRGPLALAVEWGTIYLADAAKSQIRKYDLQGKPAGALPAPWLDDQWADLRVSPFGLVVTLPRFEYTISRWDGRFLETKGRTAPSGGEFDQGKGPWPLGQDRLGNRYERASGDRGLVARRVNKAGAVVAVADLEPVGEIHDWYLSLDGGLYALSYQWGQGEIERARVYEILPQVNFSSPPGGMDPAPPPVVLGRPLPSKIRLTFGDWAPVEVTAEADLWNIWQLLSSATPAKEPEPGPDYWGFGIEAALPDGSTQKLQVRHNNLWADGKRYELPFYEGLNSLVRHHRFSESSLKAALDGASSVQVAILDWPGKERVLTASEREELRQALTGTIPVNGSAGPHPLEPPFPQRGILLEGAGWTGRIVLNGDRYIWKEYGGTALHSGRLAALVKQWQNGLLQKLDPSDVRYLFLAERLEIGEGADLTRWKNTVVRRLANARVNPDGRQPPAMEPFTLTFWVAGEKRTVQVDVEGYSYAGKRSPASGLTEILYLQGVP